MFKDFTDELMKAIVQTLHSSDPKVKQAAIKHGILLLQTIIPKLTPEEREKLSNDVEQQLREALSDSIRMTALVVDTGLSKIKMEE